MDGCCFDGHPSKNSAYDACFDVIDTAIREQLRDDQGGVVVDGLPTLGKSHQLPEILQQLQTDYPDLAGFTYLTHRHENRDQLQSRLLQEGLQEDDRPTLTSRRLPAFEVDCPTARGDHGEYWQNRVRSLRNRGLSPSVIHRQFDVPCEGGSCKYSRKWDQYKKDDVLIGHPTHAYIDGVTQNRVVIFDEDPGDAYRYQFDANELHNILSDFLQGTDSIPVNDKESLTTLRSDEGLDEVRQEILEQLQSDEFDDGIETVLRDERGHVYAPDLVAGLLAYNSEDGLPRRRKLENGIEYTVLSDDRTLVYDRREGMIYLRDPPDFAESKALVGLDGTPTMAIWRGRLGREQLTRSRVLCDDCRETYLQDVLGYEIIQTTDATKPYSSGHHVNPEKDRALLHAVCRHTDEDIGVITTKKAADQVLGVDDGNELRVWDWDYFGNIKGSNEFQGDKLSIGAVLGSRHPSDREIMRLAALDGTAAARERDSDEPRKGSELSYGTEADAYLVHVRENSVAQAIFRFGRKDGATVFVHTDAIPDWVPSRSLNFENQGVVRTRSPGEREVLKVLEGTKEMTAHEITDQVSVGYRAVISILNSLYEDNIVSRTADSEPFRWSPQEVSTRSPTAHVILPTEYVSRLSTSPSSN
jgi:hypothetical protein